MVFQNWAVFPLATKFALGSATIALTVALLTGAYAVKVLTDQFQAGIAEELDLEAAVGSERIRFYLERENRNLKNLAKTSIVTNAIADSFGRQNYLLPLLRDLSDSEGALSDIALYDFSGQAIAKLSSELASDISKKPFFETVIGNKPGISLDVNSAGKDHHVSLAYPVVYSATQTVEGILLAFLHVEILPGLILQDMPVTSHMRLVDSDGNTIGPWTWPEGLEMLSQSVPLTLTAPLDQLSLRFEVGHIKSAVLAPLTTLTWRMALVNVILIVVVVIVATLFGRQISRPLRRLELIANSVTEQGNFDVDIPVLGNDEVGRLSHSFREMLGFVAVSNRVLETRVRDRTSELDKARTQLRDNLNLTQSILNNVVDGIITVDLAGTISSCNRAATRLLKCDAEDLVDRNISEVLEIDSFDALLSQVSNDSEYSGRKVHETVLSSPDGPPVFIEYAVGDRMEIDHRHIMSFLIRDVSERKEIERLKQEFVASVSHELRTPLTSISGALSLARRDKAVLESERLQKLLGMASDNSKHLTELVNDILDLEKIEGGLMNFDLAEVDIVELVRRSIDTSSTYLQKHRKRVRILCQENACYLVNVDALRISQVMNNLLSNSAKYSAEHSEIDVIIACAGRFVRVSVIDQGEGIPSYMRGNVFTRFWQADGSNTRRVGGTGLGLAITRSLVEGNGGTIGYRSRRGTGTVFYFDLPCDVPEMLDDHGSVPPEKSGAQCILAAGPTDTVYPIIKNDRTKRPGDDADVVLVPLETPARAVLYLTSLAFEKRIIPDLGALDAACSLVFQQVTASFDENKTERTQKRFPLLWMSTQHDDTRK